MFVLRFIFRNRGTTGGKSFEAFTVPSLSEALERDGCVKLMDKKLKDIVIPEGYDLIAGFIREPTKTRKADYHLYKYFELSMCWFDKMGFDKPVKGTDGRAQLVRDVHRADRQGYDTFIGYFLSPKMEHPLNILIEDENGKLVYGTPPLRSETMKAVVAPPPPRLSAA